MKNKILKTILIYIIITIILLFLSNLYILYVNDEITTYGFSYNIARGLLPYKDYNMIIGPLYSLLMAIPIKIFGNKIILYELFNIMLYSGIFTILYNKYKKKVIILIIAYLCCYTLFIYNNFCIFLLITILLLLDSKYKNKTLLIGLLIGCIIITKHNIGGVLALIYFFTGKDKIKRTIYGSIPVIIMFIYLLLTNTLSGYLDYCIFGMGNFLDNILIEPIPLVIFIIMLYVLIKDYKKTKQEYILYIIGSYILLFPLMDFNHILVCILPFIYHLIKLDYKWNNYLYLLFVSFIIFTIIIRISDTLLSPNVLVLDNNFLKYKIVSRETYERLQLIDNFYKTHNERIYILGDNSYITKIYLNKDIDFYDLINKGNLGKNESKFIDDMINYCDKNKCYFIIDKEMYPSDNNIYSQLILDFRIEVENKYNYVETTDYYKVYES